jgi:hypothetical protein
MNKVRMSAASALRHAGSWLAPLALVALAGIACAAGAVAQTGTPAQMRPPLGHAGQMGQMGVHPPTAPAPPASTHVATPKTTEKGEQFFIIASIDQTKSEILLKRPDEVTLLLNATPKTQYFDESGKPLKLSDLRAGDTVWVVATGGAQPTAVHIRKGQMTIAELHHYYLDYPEIK